MGDSHLPFAEGYVHHYDPSLDWTPESASNNRYNLQLGLPYHSDHQLVQQSDQFTSHPYPTAPTPPFPAHRSSSSAIPHNPFAAISRNRPNGGATFSSADSSPYYLSPPPLRFQNHVIAPNNESSPKKEEENSSIPPSHVLSSATSTDPRLSSHSSPAPPGNKRPLMTPSVLLTTDRSQETEEREAKVRAVEKTLQNLDASIEKLSDERKALRKEARNGADRTDEERALVASIRSLREEYSELVELNAAVLGSVHLDRARLHLKKPRGTSTVRFYQEEHLEH